MDIGSAVGRGLGITDEDLLALRSYRESDRFSPMEKAAIELAEAMTRTPADISDELRARLLQHMSRGQLTELASLIAWENHRARLNRAFGVRAMGFSGGQACVLPER
jgi:alkylhydroperoxidase family enzyme